MMATFTIGVLSQHSGIRIPTIRYYEEIGLLPEPGRSAGGRRVYSQDDIDRAIFIKHARSLGFEIDDIRSLLSLLASPDQPCNNADQIAGKHLKKINGRISSLTALRDELEAMLGNCPGDSTRNCNVIKTISDHARCLHDSHDD